MNDLTVTATSVGASLHKNHYRADIDGLRAVAILSVVICHAAPKALPGGFVGVDIFFVISGYLISSIIIADTRAARFSLWSFYDRRIRRIFPALTLVLVATLVAGWFLLFQNEFRTLGGHVAASSLFSENFLLWSESGYFDVGSEKKPLLNLWSLAIEEQFYLFWPLLLYAAWRGHLNFLAVFVALGLVSFLAGLHYATAAPVAAYYSPLGRFWELMIGSCLAYVQFTRPGLLAKFGNAQSLVGAGLLAAALIWISPTRQFPGAWALLPTLGAALLISAGPASVVNRTILATRPFVWCGLISYPLYLWHWPLLSYAHFALGGVSTERALLLVLIAALLAAWTFWYVERPLRTNTGRSNAIFQVAAMSVVMCAGAAAAFNLVPSRLAPAELPARTEWDFLKDRFGSSDRNMNGFYPIADGRAGMTLFIGDSQLAQYAERVDKVVAGDRETNGALFAVGGGCIPILDVSTTDPLRNGCWDLRDRAYRLAVEPRFDTIVIGGSWNWYLLHSDYTLRESDTNVPVASSEGREHALIRLERVLARLKQARKRVYLLLGNPIDSALAPGRPLERLGGHGGPDFTIAISQGQMELRRALLRIAERTHVEVIDPFAAICTAGQCRVREESGMPLFKDSSHFNPDWAVAGATFIDVTVKHRALGTGQPMDKTRRDDAPRLSGR